MSAQDSQEGQPISDFDVKNTVIAEMPSAIGWQCQNALVAMACEIHNSEIKAATLNQLMVMPGHQQHQLVVREIQLLGHPSSVPYIRQMLESRFEFLAYTYSEHKVIAKWFSHALAHIGTPAAIDMIKEFSVCDDAGIASEMTYRLAKIAT